MMKPKNYIELHCFIESSRGTQYDEYELSIRIGQKEFEQAKGYIGRSSAMRALKTIVTATGLPWVENKHSLHSN